MPDGCCAFLPAGRRTLQAADGQTRGGRGNHLFNQTPGPSDTGDEPPPAAHMRFDDFRACAWRNAGAEHNNGAQPGAACLTLQPVTALPRRTTSVFPPPLPLTPPSPQTHPMAYATHAVNATH